MRQLLFSTCIIFLTACSGEVDGSDEIEPSFISEVISLSDDKPDLDAEVVKVMEKLQICTTVDTILELPPCESKFFRIFEYKFEQNIKEGFMVEMVPGLFNTPVHQLVVIDNIDGKYSIVNQYLGILLEMRTRENGFNDLLMGYDDPEIGMVAIRHEWQGAKYEPIDVEEINNHYVKEEMKDSINAIFIPAFNAGH